MHVTFMNAICGVRYARTYVNCEVEINFEIDTLICGGSLQSQVTIKPVVTH